MRVAVRRALGRPASAYRVNSASSDGLNRGGERGRKSDARSWCGSHERPPVRSSSAHVLGSAVRPWLSASWWSVPHDSANPPQANRTSCSDSARPSWDGTVRRANELSASAKSTSANRAAASATTSSAPALSQATAGTQVEALATTRPAKGKKQERKASRAACGAAATTGKPAAGGGVDEHEVDVERAEDEVEVGDREDRGEAPRRVGRPHQRPLEDRDVDALGRHMRNMDRSGPSEKKTRDITEAQTCTAGWTASATAHHALTRAMNRIARLRRYHI